MGEKAVALISGSGIQIIDLGEIGNPQELSFLPLPGITLGDLFIRGSTAFVAAGNAGLIVFDLSDPSQPRQIGSAPTLGAAWDILVKESYAILAVDYQGIEIFDISDATQPRSIANVPFDGGPDGDRAFTLSNDGSDFLASGSGSMLRQFSFDDPIHPVSTLGLFINGGTLLGGDLLVLKNAMIACALGGPMLSWDLTPPLPQDTRTLRPYQDVAAASCSQMQLRDDLIFASRASGLVAVDVQTPHIPITIATAPASGLGRDVDLVGDTILLATDKGLSRYRLDRPPRPITRAGVLFGRPCFEVSVDPGVYDLEVTEDLVRWRNEKTMAAPNGRIFYTRAEGGEASHYFFRFRSR